MENEEITEEVLRDWVEIQSASCTGEAQLDKKENSVVIKDSLFTHSAVFPPRNHEDLPVESLNQNLLVEGQPEIIVSMPSDDQNGEGGEGKVEKKKDGAGRWITMPNLGLSSAIGKIVAGMMKKGGAFKASIWIWWFASATTGVGALALVVVLSRRAKRWQVPRKVQPESNLHHLMLLIKSKDQVHYIISRSPACPFEIFTKFPCLIAMFSCTFSCMCYLV